MITPMPCDDDAENLSLPESVSSEELSPASPMSTTPSEMSISALAAHCIREIDTYRKGQPSDERFGVELFRRATMQGDQDAWACLRQCFGELVRGWMYRHSAWEVASGLESEENYLALTFERFWLAAAYHQQLDFSTLASALKYLRVSLNSAILDVLRASRTKEVALPEPGSPGEPAVEDSIESSELWEFLQQLFPKEREQRLIYLLYHCGLKPREIVRLCPQAFNDVREVYRLHRSIVERLLRNADRLRWRLGSDE